MKLDATDLEIVQLLQGNGRLTHEQIAREVHLSRPAVHERIKRLEESGIIRGYRVQVDWEAIGLPLTAFIWVRTLLSCHSAGQHILALTTKTAVVEECHRVAGEWCLIVKTRSASALALQELLDNIGAVSGVQNIMTTVVLSTISETPIRAASPESTCDLPGNRGLPTRKEVGLVPHGKGNVRVSSTPSRDTTLTAQDWRRS